MVGARSRLSLIQPLWNGPLECCCWGGGAPWSWSGFISSESQINEPHWGITFQPLHKTDQSGKQHKKKVLFMIPAAADLWLNCTLLEGATGGHTPTMFESIGFFLFFFFSRIGRALCTNQRWKSLRFLQRMMRTCFIYTGSELGQRSFTPSML